MRSSTKSIVVVLTPELLKRVWCAGEIVAWPTFSVVGWSGGKFESAKKHETFWRMSFQHSIRYTRNRPSSSKMWASKQNDKMKKNRAPTQMPMVHGPTTVRDSFFSKRFQWYFLVGPKNLLRLLPIKTPSPLCHCCAMDFVPWVRACRHGLKDDFWVKTL